MSTRTLSSPLPALASALLLALAALASPARARADEDPMAPYRERFKAGMELYKAGDLATAIAGWEAIYREVGADKGYRVAFDLARAYAKSGDEAHARERYEAFLKVVDQRRASGVTLEPVVLQEETDARGEVARIAAAQSHVAPAPVPAAPPVAPSAHVAPPLAVQPRVAAPPPAPEVHHPLSPVLLVAAGSATVLAIAVCAVEYANAYSQENAFNAAAGQSVAVQTTLRSTYNGTVPIAYGALGASIGLAAITTGLTVWYFAGAKVTEPAITPVAGPVPGGMTAGLVGHF